MKNWYSVGGIFIGNLHYTEDSEAKRRGYLIPITATRFKLSLKGIKTCEDKSIF